MTIGIAEAITASTVTGRRAAAMPQQGILRWRKENILGSTKGVLVLAFWTALVFLVAWWVTGKLYLTVPPLCCLLLALSSLFISEVVQVDETGIHRWRGRTYSFIAWSKVAFWQVGPYSFVVSNRAWGPVTRLLFATKLPPPPDPEAFKKFLVVLGTKNEGFMPVPDPTASGKLQPSEFAGTPAPHRLRVW
jgi:hypothetical protein